ncbi:MAG: 4'-phosphopantetheinyl transferase superfamily protein [Muribaculum sp.]|nr:4'-phosphopantetheinyl transferase superfamily protein [Muribaculum sp.]MDE6458414.1 4'-phosphopantetheinyl transferase superfamily protein [Muribaculum sp.]
MIERLQLAGIDIYVTAFTPDELATPQAEAQKSAVRRLLTAIEGSEAQLCHHDDGSPYIAGFSREISISHCKGYAAIGIGNTARIGIDIETPRATLRRVTRKFLSEEEQKQFTDDEALLTAWTMKEALYKAAGIAGIDFANGIKLPQPGSFMTEIAGTVYRVESVTIANARLTAANPYSFMP